MKIDLVGIPPHKVTEGDGEVMLLNVGQKSFHIINDILLLIFKMWIVEL